MYLSRERPLCCCLSDVGNVLVRAGEMQSAESCLMNLFPVVLGKVLWEGST